MSDQIKLTFMQKAAKDYLAAVQHAMEFAITKTNSIKSGSLRNSVGGTVAAMGSNVEAKLKFNEYGRFLDMGVSKGHPLGGQVALKTNLNKKMKRKKIYAAIAYGNLNGLIGDLAYGFTEEAVAGIKGELGV